MAVLAALSAGAGGELGRQAWMELTRMIRNRSHTSGDNEDLPVGQAELESLRRAPGNDSRARELERALQVRGDADAEFRRDIETWNENFLPGLSQNLKSVTKFQNQTGNKYGIIVENASNLTIGDQT